MSANGGQSLEAAHADVVADNSLQFTMQPFEKADPPKWLMPLLEFLQSAAPYLQYLLWAGIAVIAGITLFNAWKVLRARWGAADPKKAAAPEQIAQVRFDERRARATLEQADRLAKEGRYNEATRVILHRSIEDIQDFDPAIIRPGVTSREIARLPALSDHGKRVFSAIARRVEESLFAGRDMNANGYSESRKEYEGFVFGGIRK